MEGGLDDNPRNSGGGGRELAMAELFAGSKATRAGLAGSGGRSGPLEAEKGSGGTGRIWTLLGSDVRAGANDLRTAGLSLEALGRKTRVLGLGLGRPAFWPRKAVSLRP